MCAQTIDRRASAPAVPCKNCGLEVDLYPSMHKCQQQQQQQQQQQRNLYLSPLPPLPTRRFSGTSNPLQVPRKPIHSLSSGSSSSQLISTSSSSSNSFSSASSPNFSDTTASPSPSSGKWSQFSHKIHSKQQLLYPSGASDDPNYLKNFETHLPGQEKKSKSLWGNVRQTQKWEQWTQQGDISKPGGKLWRKLRLAAQNMADKIPSHDDKGPESDESDWEGETHVSRILREYYVKKRRSLPPWLRDEGTITLESNQQHSGGFRFTPSPTTPSRRRRLWDEPDRRHQVYDQYLSTSREISFDHAQQKQPGRHYQSNNNDQHHITRSPQRNQNRYDDNDNIQRGNRYDINYQQHRRQSYQTSPSLSNDIEQKRRFSIGYTSPTTQQRQYDDEDEQQRLPTPTFHQDRLLGPRTRPSKHHQH